MFHFYGENLYSGSGQKKLAQLGKDRRWRISVSFGSEKLQVKIHPK
jgi:hypothetical protein